MTGDTATHALLWQNGVMADLGTLPADASSFAYAINDSGQVVGQSCDLNGNCRAFLWQNGTMSDLNTITDLNTSAGSFGLVNAQGINARGEIVGFGTYQNGQGRAYAALPCADNTIDGRGCTSGGTNATRSEVPKAVSPDRPQMAEPRPQGR